MEDLSNSVFLYRTNIHDDLQQAISSECSSLCHEDCPNFWWPLSDIQSDVEPVLATQILIRTLYEEIMQFKVSAGLLGVEVWVQKYERGKGLAFHFDKDEEALRSNCTMRHPQYSSVVYLTGATQARQAPTIVLAQRYDQEGRCPVPEDPCASALVFPRQGNVLIFDGGMAHGVLESGNMDVRMTLLINWWSSHPLDVPELTLPRLKNNGVTLPEQARVQELLQQSAALNCSPAAVAMCELEVQEEEPVQVDELCAEKGVQLRGREAQDCLLVEHTGLVLVPVETEQDMDCAAVWIPVQMVSAYEDEQ